ncbi:hypothetical protein [Lysobacter soli]|nr:hypothetical protein [Lysobacter soli]
MIQGRSRLFVVGGVACVILLAVAARPVANFAGVCVPQMRRLDRDEQLQHVYEYLKARNLQTARGVDGQIVEKVNNGFGYASYADFARANPECCTFSLKGPANLEIAPMRRLTGARRSFVRVEYRANWDGSNLSSQMKTRHLLISNCGEVDEITP